MKLAFILTMPNVGSWNGKWTGEDRVYCKTREVTTAKYHKLLENKNFYYRWSDGWTAKIEVFPCSEKRKEIRKSAGFCGYDWMIDSILTNGYITC